MATTCSDIIEPVCSTGEPASRVCVPSEGLRQATRWRAPTALHTLLLTTALTAPCCPARLHPAAERKNFTNVCYAQLQGATVACLGTCPCSDPIAALEDVAAGGGVLLVPTDDALLAAVESLNATAAAGDWLSDPALLQALLARHTVLAANQRSGVAVDQLLSGTASTRVTTEAGQQIDGYPPQGSTPSRVQVRLPAGVP